LRGGVERERERGRAAGNVCTEETADELGAKFRGGDLFHFGHCTISLFQNWTLKLQEKLILKL